MGSWVDLQMGRWEELQMGTVVDLDLVAVGRMMGGVGHDQVYPLTTVVEELVLLLLMDRQMTMVDVGDPYHRPFLLADCIHALWRP